MRHLRGILFCLFASLLAACNQTTSEVASAPSPETTPAAAVPEGEVAGVQTVAQAQSSKPAAGPSGPPQFSSDYRSAIAMSLVHDYAKEGLGSAEITSPVSGKGLLTPGENQGSVSLCVQYPVDAKAFSFLTSDGKKMRAIVISAHRSLLTGGKLSVRRSINDRGPPQCSGETTRFVELENMAQKLKACQAQSGNCSITRRAGTNDFTVQPATIGPGGSVLRSRTIR